VRSHFQFGRRGLWLRLLCAAAGLALTVGILALCHATGAGQQSPEVVAHIQGSDISINGELLKKASTLVSVANGNVVTVHSGQASMRLVDGGEISICGPAKFTVLESNATITLALEFGSVHFELPSSVSLRLLTASIVATPIEIQGGKRDLTVGLDQNNSMCVLAATGAVQLEQQLSGERMIVPELGDFSLEDGQLVPGADTGQSCQCASLPMAEPGVPVPSSPPQRAMLVPPAQAPTAAPSMPAVSQPPLGVAQLGTNHDEHPSAPEQETAVKPPAMDPATQDRIMLPPVTFSSNSPFSPAAPTEETALLVREVRANPDWEFTGRVETPGFAKAMSSALGEGGAAETASSPAGNAVLPKKRGFWHAVKKILIGEAPQ
jgi:hypothetical protein